MPRKSEYNVDCLDEICDFIKHNDNDKRRIEYIKREVKKQDKLVSEIRDPLYPYPTNALLLMFQACRVIYKQMKKWKSIHDMYRTRYESCKNIIDEKNDEIEALQKTIKRLERENKELKMV